MQHISSVAQSAHQRSWLIALCLIANVVVATSAAAQSTDGSTADTSAASVEDDDVAALDRAEPDFVVVNLPTTLRLPVFKGNFRLTHRFAGNLRNGTFGQQASSLFGIDLGAVIGFEYRLAPVRDVQAVFYRSSFDKTIQLRGQYDAIRQRRLPVSISPMLSVEGTDNFQEKYAPAVGAVISRTVGTRLAVYITPVWVHNTTAALGAIDHNHDSGVGTGSVEATRSPRSTGYMGVGSRIRLGSSAYVAAEVVPRVSGYAPDQPAYGVSVEKRVGSHMFSLTFTNTFGTTSAQVARGGAANSLYLGFNLGRKFF